MIDVRGADVYDSNGDGAVTILEVALANPLDNLDGLLGAVGVLNQEDYDFVTGALGDPNASWTVFAPDNEAFEAIPANILTEIAAVDGITGILLYHVVAGTFDPRRVFYVRSVESIGGQDLFVKRGKRNPTINNSEIGCTGVRTDNGLVWIIDSVLLPQF
jgi:uncharacterized surface protein with fasciclin (FAS1) repeats